MPLSRLFRRLRSPEPERDPNYSDYDWLFKVLMVGDKGTGKSSFLRWLRDETFTENELSTIGVEFMVKRITIDGISVKCNIWDTGGDLRYRNVTKAFYRGSAGVIIVYDVTKRSSFENLQYWCDSVKQSAENARIIIVGSKCDLREDRVVDYTTAKDFADSVGLPLIEVSSKTGTNIEQAYVTLIASFVQKGGKP